MMGVARGGHGQAADLGILESVAVVATQSGGGVKKFERIDGQGFQNGEADPGAEQIVRVGRNGQAAAFVNDFAHFARRLAFQVGQGRADAKEMTIRSGNLDPGHDEKSVDRLAVLTHQALLEKVSNRVASVVIRDGKRVQAFFAGGGDVLLRAGDAVPREKSMRMEVDVEGHRGEASLGRAKCKASVSRNGRWSGKRWAAESKRFSCAKAELPRGARDLVFATTIFFSCRLSFTSKWERSGYRKRSCRQSGTGRSKFGTSRSWKRGKKSLRGRRQRRWSPFIFLMNQSSGSDSNIE